MDLTKAESIVRAHVDGSVPVPCLTEEERVAVMLVLGELERLRAIEQRAREAQAWADQSGSYAFAARYILGETTSR